MCGRFTLRNPKPVINQFETGEFLPRFNIAPNQKILTISGKSNFVKWGFTPYWASKPFNLINARAETLWKKPSFRDASRCLIPADGWYEWKNEGEKKTPYFHYLKDQSFCFAGIYGGYRGEVGCAIVTIEASENLKAIHHRMPAILDKSFYLEWIKGEEKDVYDLSIDTKVEFFEVSKHVNNPGNDDEKCIFPI
jgi:putative SOS response-associated peptidase YedK